MQNLVGKYIKVKNREGFVVYDDEYTVVIKDKIWGTFMTISKHTLNKEGYSIVKAPTLAYNNNFEVRVTKELCFDSCHNLIDYNGKCANLHGHTYKVQVTFAGICDSKGFLLDFNQVKHLMKEYMVDVLDHQYLNDILKFNTTAENMVMFFYDVFVVLVNKLYDSRVRVESVKLWETPTSFAEFKL